jgi:hypothetical protein
MKIRGPTNPEPAATFKPKPGRWFFCVACDGKAASEPRFQNPSDGMTIDEAKLHLSERHGVNASGSDFQGTKRAVAHGDGREYYVWIWLWQIGDFILIEHDVSLRNPTRR